MGRPTISRSIEYYRERLRDGGTRPLSYEDEQQRLAGENMGLVWKRMGHDDDLTGGGLIGLVLASHRYDASRGTKFSTCASYWIRQAARRWGEAPNKPVHIPEHMFRRLSFVGPPTKEQRDLIDSVEAVLAAHVLSIDVTFSDHGHSDGYSPLIPSVSDPEPIESHPALSMARGRLREEYPSYAAVIDRLFPADPFAMPETCASIGRDTGVSTQAVLKCKEQALWQLRRYLREIRETKQPLCGV